jgi:hypothetical protein
MKLALISLAFFVAKVCVCLCDCGYCYFCDWQVKLTDRH